MERQAFNRQPARAVIVDLHPPMDAVSYLNIHQALSTTLNLISHLTGLSRVPLFALSILRSFNECLFPLQSLKGNYARINTALTELRSFANELSSHSLHNSRGSLLEGIQESLSHFNRLTLSMKQTSSGLSVSCPTQLEIIILTAREPATVRQGIERGMDTLDLEHLKKLSVVCVSDPDSLMQQDKSGEDEELPSLSQMPSSPTDLSLSIIDMASLDNDVLSLQSYFKSWLHNCGTDNENLHLLLPSFGGGQQSVLKCDLHERMLPLTSLPQSLTKNFKLMLGSELTSSSGKTSTSPTPHPVPLYKLKAVSLVSTDGVCESVLYGDPLIVKPTACWKLDWEELESNQQQFMALCQQLAKQGQALLACTEDQTNISPASSSPVPLGHFLLFPSPSPSSLLIKSVLTAELLLPVEAGECGEEVSKDALDNIGNSLNQLETMDTYNPLLVSSQLHEVLMATSMRKTTPKVGSRKKASASQDSAVPVSRGRGGAKKARIARGGFVYGGGNLHL